MFPINNPSNEKQEFQKRISNYSKFDVNGGDDDYDDEGWPLVNQI